MCHDDDAVNLRFESGASSQVLSFGGSGCAGFSQWRCSVSEVPGIFLHFYPDMAANHDEHSDNR